MSHDLSAASHPLLLTARAFDAHRAGRLHDAERLYRESLALDADQPVALHYFGVLHHQLGRHAQASVLLRTSLQLDDRDAACWSNLGLVLAALGDHDSALACYREALERVPGFADALNNLGVSLVALERFDDAVKVYRDAIAADPQHVDAHLNLAVALNKQKRHDDALDAYRATLALDPRNADAHFGMGNAFTDLGQAGAAIVAFERAIALRPTFARAHVNLGSLVGKRGAYADAERCYRRAVELQPNATNLVCLGGALSAQAKTPDDEALFHRALALDPNHASAHQALAWAQLRRGVFDEGWASYARRWKKADYDAIRLPGVPEWRGEALDGKHVLLVGEEGFGDQIQFVRYAAELARRGAIVDAKVRHGLAALFASVPGVRHAFSDARADTYDFWVPMLSVPSNVATTLDTIPSNTPYLTADAAKAASWQARMQSAAGERRRVGIVWSGSPTFGNDRYRSMPASTLAELGDVHDIAWFSLQKPRAGEAPVAPPFALHDFTADLHDFTDTAALVANLDQVIAVDTGVAHLAGALGRPVWIMLPFNSDWRWLTGRSDSPWYPTARLFRQSTLGEWQPVVAEVRAALSG